MRIYLYSYIILLLLGSRLWAQTIYPCQAHTETGEPIEYQLEWTISPKGEYINLLLSNDGKEFGEEFIYFMIDKKAGDSYIPFDSKAYHIEPSTTWIVHNYKLIEPGEFLVYFVNSTQKRIAEQTIKVKYKDIYSYSSDDITDVYYDNCQMVFCQRVLAGKPHRILSKSAIKNGNALVYIYLNNYKSLNSRKLNVQIWRKGTSEFEYSEFEDSKKYRIDPLWNDTYFRYTFTAPGEYKVAVYNERDALIKFNFIRIY